MLAAALVLAAGTFTPEACQAGLFDWCQTRHHAQAAPATFAPAFTAQRVALMPGGVCDPCAAPQVAYVPEVRYRWTYSRISRTEYQPVAAIDPCSGCATTTYRPVERKSLLPWLHREAYTTYQPVPMGVAAAPVSAMLPACNPCGVGGMAAPSLGSSCAGCAPASTVISSGPVVDPGYSGQTFDVNPPGSTWSPSDSGSDSRLRPAPDAETEGKTTVAPTGMPQLIIPTGRTASRGAVQTVSYYEPVSLQMMGNLYQAAAAVPAPLRLVPVEPEM